MAQTYTHLLIGIVVGESCFPGPYHIGTVMCAGASIAPDLVMMPQWAFDRVRGRTPLQDQSDTMMFWKEVGHSLLLWLLCTMISFVLLPQWVVAGAFGGLLHVLVDIFTHGKGTKEERPLFWDTDVLFMWPTTIDLRPLGLWEYRRGFGDLKPKWQEACVDVLCVLWIGALWMG